MVESIAIGQAVIALPVLIILGLLAVTLIALAFGMNDVATVAGVLLIIAVVVFLLPGLLSALRMAQEAMRGVMP